MKKIDPISKKFLKGNQCGTQFTRERSLGNQHAKGNPPNRTSFTTENTMENHACWRGGLQKMDDGYYVATGTKTRVRRSRLVYQTEHGEIPHGWIIYHKNGDCHDDRLENLIAITRGELAKINKTVAGKSSGGR